MLSKSQVARLEQRLLEERKNAVRMLRDSRRDLDGAGDYELTRTPSHLADQGSDAQKEMFEIQNAARHSELLALIDGALRRLWDSPEDYDLSVVSGRRIPFQRLELVPWTRVLADEIAARPHPSAAMNGNGARLRRRRSKAQGTPVPKRGMGDR